MKANDFTELLIWQKASEFLKQTVSDIEPSLSTLQPGGLLINCFGLSA